MLVCEVCASASSMWVSVRVEFCVVGVLFNKIDGGLNCCCGRVTLAYDVLGGVVVFDVFVGGVLKNLYCCRWIGWGRIWVSWLGDWSRNSFIRSPLLVRVGSRRVPSTISGYA